MVRRGLPAEDGKHGESTFIDEFTQAASKIDKIIAKSRTTHGLHPINTGQLWLLLLGLNSRKVALDMVNCENCGIWRNKDVTEQTTRIDTVFRFG